MSQGDHSGSGGSFLSRMARLVHPGAPTEALSAAAPESARLDRQTLRAIIERKRRNDEVRRREFDFLRDIFYKKRAQQTDQTVSGASEALSSLNSDPDGSKAQTIAKIARIEAQMSQHWLQRPGQPNAQAPLHKIASAMVPRGQLEGGLTDPGHLQTRTTHLPIDLVGEDHHEPTDTVSGNSNQVAPPALSDAAVQFAKGDDAGAERSLRALMAQEVLSPVARSAWLALLDLRHAQGDVTRFEDLAAEYAERFHCAMPHWPSPEEPVPSQPAPEQSRQTQAQAVVWTCPPLLEQTDVQQLERLVAAGSGPFWFDWTGLVSAELAAAQALLALVDQWLQQPLAFRFRGGGVLRRRLKASTPSGRRENDTVWWQLRLALLRLMGRTDEFDLAALDYCVTYGVLPPSWEAPLCSCEPTDQLPIASRAAAVPEPALQAGDPSLVLDWPPMVAAAQLEPEPSTGPRLSGMWHGDLSAALAELDLALARHPRTQVFAIDCQQLKRLDFVAASALMQWLLKVLGQGVRVELTHVGRLLAAFFHVVGLDEVVTVRLRQY